VVDRSQLERSLLPVVCVFVLLAIVLLVPPLAVMIGVLIPVPLIFVYMQMGRRLGLVLLAAVFLVLYTFIGPKQAVLFFTEYAVLAGVMAETIRFRLSFDKCIIFSTLVSAVLSVTLLLFVFNDREATFTEFFQKQIEGHFAQSIEALKEMGDKPEELKAMQDFSDKASGSLAQCYPSFIVIGSFITALINYYSIRFLWGRIYGYDLFHQAKFSSWFVSDQVVWALIGSSTIFFLNDNILGAVGLNLLILALVVYFFQGLSLIIYFLESRNVPVFFWVLIFVVIVFQPLLIGASIGLGIFDIWMDMRKVRTNTVGITG
jgi:uncharacterized protein YybS (DUF2232 family)